MILQLMAAGEKLRTKAVRPEVDAWIGHAHIDADLVTQLEKQKLIRCSHVWNKGPLHGKFCDYELTDKGRSHAR